MRAPWRMASVIHGEQNPFGYRARVLSRHQCHHSRTQTHSGPNCNLRLVRVCYSLGHFVYQLHIPSGGGMLPGRTAVTVRAMVHQHLLHANARGRRQSEYHHALRAHQLFDKGRTPIALSWRRSKPFTALVPRSVAYVRHALRDDGVRMRVRVGAQIRLHQVECQGRKAHN